MTQNEPERFCTTGEYYTVSPVLPTEVEAGYHVVHVEPGQPPEICACHQTLSEAQAAAQALNTARIEELHGPLDPIKAIEYLLAQVSWDTAKQSVIDDWPVPDYCPYPRSTGWDICLYAEATLRALKAEPSNPPCRVCADRDGGLCDGCRGTYTLEAVNG